RFPFPRGLTSACRQITGARVVPSDPVCSRAAMSSSSLSAPCRAVGTPGRQVRHKRSWHAHEWDDREELLAATFGFLSRNEVPALLKEGSVLTHLPTRCSDSTAWC